MGEQQPSGGSPAFPAPKIEARELTLNGVTSVMFVCSRESPADAGRDGGAYVVAEAASTPGRSRARAWLKWAA